MIRQLLPQQPLWKNDNRRTSYLFGPEVRAMRHNGIHTESK
jgi:hypothetical protein